MAELQFRLLGPLEVWRDGRQVAVRGAKLRVLLAILLLHADEAVSTDQLIDALWGEHPPASAANALQAHVAALRRVLDPDRASTRGEGVLATCAPGYRLRVGGDDLDIACFERLVAAGRGAAAGDPPAAARLLREALDLWRGRALADFIFEPFARSEAARLEELRLIVLVDRLELDLALGRHAAVVPELEALVAEHPLRERFAGQLMVALYRADRQADACRVYHTTRAVLVEQLGMEPGPRLRELLQRVLVQDPTLGVPRPSVEIETAAGGRAKTTPAPAHNLPVEVTSFIGREREVEEVRAQLDTARLLTLTGAGGSGKTRLALRVARQVVAGYPDGVWLIELAALADPSLVAKATASVLGVHEEGDSLIQTLARRLRSSRILLVLDNCEHLLESCAELAHELLSTCEGIRILATSRESLNISGEVSWPVPGLPFPDAAALPPLAELKSHAAIRLFGDRAVASSPEFTIGTDNGPSVARLCQRLDGIPLAIELAAARARMLSPQEIVQRLDDRFALLTGGSRDAVARQQTLRATVDWSHDLLDESERILLRRLSVFAGGWTVADSEQVCADEALPAKAVFDVLFQLAAKSLVVTEPIGDGATRYRLLETLRAYAGERLAAAGEEHAIRRRHLIHFLELAELAHEEKPASGSDAGLAMLAAQQDNLRAALAFAQAADPAGMLRLATAIEQLWLAGNVTEGRRWLDEALARAPERTLERARALHTAGSLAAVQQDLAEARQLVSESLTLASSHCDKPGESWARLTLGWIEFVADEPVDAIRHLERSLALHEARGDRLGVCRSLIFSGMAMTRIPARRQQGRSELERAVQVAHELEDAWGEGFGLVFLGFADAVAGEQELAATRFQRAVLTEALGPIRAGGLDGLAELAVEHDPLRALRLLGAATAHRQRYAGQPPPHVKRKAAAIRARAEQRTDAPTAQQAWDEGLQMSTEQAVAYALKDQGRTDAP